MVAEPEAGADANQGYGYSPYGHSGHGYGHLPYGHPLSKREAEAEAEAEPEADPALLYGGYYGYGLGYYGGYRGYYSHPYAVAAGVPYANGWTDGPNNGVGYGYHYLGKREAEAEPEAEEVEAVVRVDNFQSLFCLPFLSENLNGNSMYCCVEFLFKFFDKSVNNRDFLKIINLY